MVNVEGNGKDGGGNPYKLSKTYHREEGAQKHKWEVRGTGGRIGVEVIWNVDIGHLNRMQAGDGGKLGGSKTDI